MQRPNRDRMPMNSPPPAVVINNNDSLINPCEPKFFIINCFGLGGTIVWDLFWFLFLVATHVINVIITGTPIKSHFYLTNVMLLVTSFFLFIHLMYLCNGAVKNSCLYKWVSILFDLSLSGELTVAVFYWSFLAREVIPDYPSTCPNLAWCYIYTSISHGLVLIPSWIMLFAGWVEMEIKYSWFPFVFGVLYIGLMLIPYSVFVEPLYGMIDFNGALSYIFLAGAIALLVVSYFVGYFVFLCRKNCLVKNYPIANCKKLKSNKTGNHDNDYA